MRLIDEIAYQIKIAKIPLEERTFVKAWETAQHMPTIDAVPVVRGEWINFVGDFSTAECNKCGEVYEVSPDENPCEDWFNAFKQFYKYCPNCGCDMRGERDGEK